MDCGGPTSPANINCIGIIIGNVIHSALVLIGPLTIIMIIISGFRFVMSHGDSKQLEGAKKTLTFAIVGLVVVVFSYLLLNIIATITGVKCIIKFDNFFSACS